MKKVISVLLTACMLFLLPACSSSESEARSSSAVEIAASGAVSESSSVNEIHTSAASVPETSAVNSTGSVESSEPSEIASTPEIIPNETSSSSTAGITEPAITTKTAAATTNTPETTKPASTTAAVTTNPASTAAAEPSQPEVPTADTLVVYFSCTGNTKAVAEKIADICGADIYEIVPAEPYTSDDLNYNNDSCRANREMNDESARPEISSPMVDLSGYDTVFIGYPIWWGTCPRIINTFLDTYDLSGKTVMPFCTSGGSGVSTSVSAIRSSEPNADVRNGLRASGANDSGIEAWINENVV